MRCRISLSAALLGATLCGLQNAAAQETPLISGGAGFITSTNGGNTTYLPVISPLIAAPLGKHFLLESRATLVESFSPKGNGKSGYDSSFFTGLSFAQLDYLANKTYDGGGRRISDAVRHLQ